MTSIGAPALSEWLNSPLSTYPLKLVREAHERAALLHHRRDTAARLEALLKVDDRYTLRALDIAPDPSGLRVPTRRAAGVRGGGIS